MLGCRRQLQQMEGLDLETLGNSNDLGRDMWRRFKDR